MVQIAQQLNNSIKGIVLLRILILIIILTSCKTKEGFNCKNEDVLNYNLSDIRTDELILAVEKYKRDQFSFGSGLFGRISPKIILFDSIDIMANYEKGCFNLFFNSNDTSLGFLLSNIEWKSPVPYYDQDSTFIYPFPSSSLSATLSVTNKRYFRLLKKKYWKSYVSKKHKISEASLEYDIYKIRFKYIYIGDKCLILPNMNGKLNKNELFIQKKVPTYFIIELISIIPFNVGHQYRINYK